jgi:NADH:ubiquinone oxidoreductase subunit 5 (subunit L)/multisubunit Na+/H+ antiporter MnhA subunit
MLAPMAVLAVGALVAGLALGPTGYLAHYVEETPGMHHSEHREPLWILVTSALIGIVGIAIGYRLSKLDPSSSLLKDQAVADWGRNRLYIDWMYDRIVVEPMEWFARLCGWLDGVVDHCVRLVADGPRWVGLAGQRFQTGRIPTYSFITAIGIAALAIWIVTRNTW